MRVLTFSCIQSICLPLNISMDKLHAQKCYRSHWSIGCRVIHKRTNPSILQESESKRAETASHSLLYFVCYCVILHNQIKVFSFMYNSLTGWRFDWLSRVRQIFEPSCLIFHDICLPTHKPELNGHSPTISCKSAPKIENWKNYVNRHHGKYEYTSFCKNT